MRRTECAPAGSAVLSRDQITVPAGARPKAQGKSYAMNKTVSLPASLTSAGEHSASSTYSIRDVADMLNMSLRTIRFYEEKGLVQPLRQGTDRIFTHLEIDALRAARKFRSIGLTIREIKAMQSELANAVQKAEKDAVIKRYMDQRLTEIKVELQHVKDQEKMVLNVLQNLTESEQTLSETVGEEI